MMLNINSIPTYFHPWMFSIKRLIITHVYFTKKKQPWYSQHMPLWTLSGSLALAIDPQAESQRSCMEGSDCFLSWPRAIEFLLWCVSRPHQSPLHAAFLFLSPQRHISTLRPSGRLLGVDSWPIVLQCSFGETGVWWGAQAPARWEARLKRQTKARKFTVSAEN